MDLITYESYFQQLFEYNKKLKGFYHIDMFEFNTFVNDLRGGRFEAPLLILESYQLGTMANHLDNITDVHDGALVVLGKFDPKLINKLQKTAFLSEIETIIKQVRTRMIEDKKRQMHFMTGLIPESLNIEKTDTIAGTFQGYRMTFTIESHDENELLTEHWNI